MATWADLNDYVHATYRTTDISPRALELLFDLGGGRSQLVWVCAHDGPEGEGWASIDSAIGGSRRSISSERF